MKKIACMTIVLVWLIGMTGCSLERRQDEVEQKDIDYTVVEDADVPDELMDVINGRKSEPFKISFSDKENLYIAVGYGEQPTGGYSIMVEKIYQTDETVELKTQFEGPVKNEEISSDVTYPYIVIKVENTEKTVKFL